MSRKTRVILAVSLVLVIAALVLPGCAAETAKSKAGGTLTVYLMEPEGIDPFKAIETEGIEVVANVFDGLVDLDPKTSTIVAAVAESWKPNADASIWTFRLKKGTKFQNGREVEAKDFKYAWERIANPKAIPPSDISYHLGPIKGFTAVQEMKATEMSGVKVKDKYTLEVTLEYPFADFIYVVAHPALAPVPKEEVEKDPKAFAEKPVGNGPFKMAEPWKHNQSIKLVKFDEYYGAKAKLGQVLFKIAKDEETAYMEFEAGKIDYTKQIPTGRIREAVDKYGKSKDGYEATPGGGVLLGAETGLYYLNLNNANSLLKNVDLRRAISLAIDREAIVKTVFESTRAPATGLIPPGVVGYTKNAGKYAKFDREEAKKLLEKAGYPEGKGLPQLSIYFNKGHEPAMQIVQANLKDIGIETELKIDEPVALRAVLGKGEHQLLRMGWTFDYPIMDSVLYSLFLSTNIGQDNTAQYSNPEVDKLIVGARKQTNEKLRVEAYQKAEAVILDEVGVVPLNFFSHRAVAQKWVKGLVYSPLSATNYSTVYIEK